MTAGQFVETKEPVDATPAAAADGNKGGEARNGQAVAAPTARDGEVVIDAGGDTSPAARGGAFVAEGRGEADERTRRARLGARRRVQDGGQPEIATNGTAPSSQETRMVFSEDLGRGTRTLVRKSAAQTRRSLQVTS